MLASREALPEALSGAIEASGARLERVETARIEAICGAGANHQGVALEVGPFPYAGLGAILERAADRADALVVVLDGIQDAGNLGAIARSAAAFGAAGLILGKDRAAGVTAGAVRRSAGAIWRVPIAQVTNVGRALEELKGHGFWGSRRCSMARAPISSRSPRRASRS